MAGKSHRVKSDNNSIEQIASFEQADQAMKQLADLQFAISQAEQAAKDKIDEVKTDLAESVTPLQDKSKQLIRTLEVFSTANRMAFDKKQSRTLSFGTLGWRKSTSISIKKTTLGLIRTFMPGKKGLAYINIKETVDRKALAKLTDERLAAVDAQRKEKEVFFAEPDLTKAVDY